MRLMQPSRALFLAFWAVPFAASAWAANSSPAVIYQNVLIHQRADPQIVKHTDNQYYFIATVPEYDGIILRQAETIQALGSATETTIWARNESDAGVGYTWAPELHRIGDKWYIYFALGITAPFDIRMFVLEGTGDNPLTAEWEEKGVIQTDWDTFSLDATTFEVTGVRYLCWAQEDPTWEEGDNTSLMLAPLENPWTIQRPAIPISRPDRDWERIGHNVNEGAYVIEKDGTVWMTYSASATDHNYAMGLLSATADADLMDPASWTKSPDPVFISNSNTSQWGPGHSSFTVSEDGLSDILVYHARGYRDISGEPLDNPDRHTRVQKLYWRSDGTPDFGVPVPDGDTPIRLRLDASEGMFLRHMGADQAQFQSGDPDLAETQFRLVEPGLSGENTVSLESTSSPGWYLYRTDSGIRLGSGNGTTAFDDSASFIQVPGLANDTRWSFESSTTQGEFIVADAEKRAVMSRIANEMDEDLATFAAE